MRTSRIGGILATAVLASGAAACGGNDDAGAVGGTAPSETSSSETDEVVADPEVSAEDAEPQGPGGYPVREDEPAATADRPGPRKPVKVTYQASGTAPDETMTLVFDGARFAMHFGGGRIIQTEDSMVFCGAEGEGCFEAPGNEQLLQGTAGAMGGLLDIEDRISDETLPASWRIVDGRSVAGRDTTCAEFEASDVAPGESGTMRYCYDEELGIGLFWEAMIDGTTQSFEAISVETPTEADFEPTGPVTSPGE